MRNKYYKFPAAILYGGKGAQAWRIRSRRQAMICKQRRNVARRQDRLPSQPYGALFGGYDPELVYVECARCGSPVIWEPGRATRLLAHAGIDPIELDAACILLTDGCPACGSKNEYSVRIFRIAGQGATQLNPVHGHA